MKVAIVHDYMNVYGGAEAVANAIYELFASADIYTSTYDAEAMAKAGAFKGANVFYPKWKDNIPGKLSKFAHRFLIANLPYYFSHLDLSDYDLVLSSTAHFAKGVKTKPPQIHISYIHTPPRFLYGYKGSIRKRSSWYWKLMLWPVDTWMRYLDRQFAKRPDHLVCNSKEVQGRIKRIYNRDATVINPFAEVDVSEEDFNNSERGDFYLIVSRLEDYKNIDLAIHTCGKNNIKLKIAGRGFDENRLKEIAKDYESVEMLGFVSDEEKKQLYQNCKGFLATVGDEDFGMAPLEPMMFGKPVVALRQGGYLETVNENVGVFFNELTEQSLHEAMQQLDSMEFDRNTIRKHALGFSKERFKKEYLGFVNSTIGGDLVDG